MHLNAVVCLVEDHRAVTARNNCLRVGGVHADFAHLWKDSCYVAHLGAPERPGLLEVKIMVMTATFLSPIIHLSSQAEPTSRIC